MKWSIVCALFALLSQVRGHPATTNPHTPPNTYCQNVPEEMHMDHCLQRAQNQLEKHGNMLQSFGKLYKGCLVSIAQTIDFMRQMCEERTVACKAKCLEVDDMRSCLEKCAKERAELKYELMKAKSQGGYPMVMDIYQQGSSEIEEKPETEEKKGNVVDDKPSENPKKPKNIPDDGMQGSPEKKAEVEEQANASPKVTEHRGNDENQNRGNPQDNQNHGNPNGNRDEKPLKDEGKDETSNNLTLVDKINQALEIMKEEPHGNLDSESHDSRPVDHESSKNNDDDQNRRVENGNDKENPKKEVSADNKDKNPSNADNPLPYYIY